MELKRNHSVPKEEAPQGQSVAGLSLTILAGVASKPATDSNAQSVVLLVRYGEFEALLTGDAPVAVEEAILDDLPSDLEVVKVGHHGSNTSTSPELAVISVGARNRYSHPHTAVVNRIIESGARILRTDLSGEIVIRARRSGLHDVRTEW